MRDIRNRIVHDYLSEDIQTIFEDILKVFVPELNTTHLSFQALLKKM